LGTRERREREREARRRAISEAAKAVFFSRGFQAATMDQIAKAAELSKGAVYSYFDSKEDLYVTILLEGLGLLHERFQQAVAGKADWDEKLRSIGWAYYQFFRENRSYYNILFLMQHGEITSRVSEKVSKACFEKGLASLKVLSEAVEQGIDEGKAQPCDPMKTAVLMWGTLNGIILLFEEEEHRRFIPASLEELIGSSMDLMLDGLRGHGSGAHGGVKSRDRSL
jgi:AcrR family transcriptional regulator